MNTTDMKHLVTLHLDWLLKKYPTCKGWSKYHLASSINMSSDFGFSVGSQEYHELVDLCEAWKKRLTT